MSTFDARQVAHALGQGETAKWCGADAGVHGRRCNEVTDALQHAFDAGRRTRDSGGEARAERRADPRCESCDMHLESHARNCRGTCGVFFDERREPANSRISWLGCGLSANHGGDHAPPATRPLGGCMLDRGECSTPDECEREKRCALLAPPATREAALPHVPVVQRTKAIGSLWRVLVHHANDSEFSADEVVRFIGGPQNDKFEHLNGRTRWYLSDEFVEAALPTKETTK